MEQLNFQNPKKLKIYFFSMVFIVPRLKLVFRGSYFLLPIGSRRPPRKRLPQGSSASFLRFHKRILIKKRPFLTIFHINHNGFFTFFAIFLEQKNDKDFHQQCHFLMDFDENRTGFLRFLRFS